MIVRVLGGEGQYRLDDAAFAAISEIDDRVQAAAEAGDEAAFSAALSELVDAIHTKGEPLPIDELIGSDAVVPADGTSLAEAEALLSTDGLIPT